MQPKHTSHSRLAATLRNAVFAPALISAMCVPFVAHAADETAANASSTGGTSWGLGVAAISSQKPYTGIGRDSLALPLIYIENDWVRVFGLGAELKLPSLNISTSQKVDFRLVALYDGSGYKADDAPILEGMKERKGGLWAGAKATWRNDIADVNVELLGDASGNSKGQRINLGLERTFRLGNSFTLAPRLGASWLDKKYVDYYYGVGADEVRAGRLSYSGKSTVNTELGARATYFINKSQSIFMDVSFTSLGNEIKDSPLVDRSSQNRVSMGYLYRF